MALKYSILKLKKNVTFNSDFDECGSVQGIDLLGKNLDIENMNLGEYGIVTVTKEYIARPDLISLALYRDDRYADIICKINGISNPFELNEGNVLIYPTTPKLSQLLQNAVVDSNEMIDSRDAAKISIQKMNTKGKKLVYQKRSPNEATVNDSNYIYSQELKGILFY